MNNYRLEELSEFIRNGASIKQFENAKGYPITRIETISDSYVNLERVGYADIMEFGKYEEYLLDIGDILMSHINSDKHLGKTAIFENENVKLIHGMNLLCIRPNKKIVSPKYLNYYFKSLDFKKQLPKITKKSVNQASFSVSDLKKLKCKIHSIENQKKIVEILDKSQELIDKRKKQIEELDLLVKSKFIEMFRGDKNFDYIKIENLVEVKSDIVDGPFGSNLKTIDYVDSGVRVIQINNIGESQFRNGNKRYITEEKFNSLIKHSVIPGDIVVAKMGEPIGRACIVPNWLEKAVIVADCMKIHPDLNVINAKYLEFLLNTEEVKVQFKKYSQGSTRVRLNLTMLRQIEVLYPPIELQNQFADFVKQVDKLKFEMEKSLKELEDNFNSLLQKAFKGELFN
ncbi:hypothetical protein B5G18_05780 [Clostridium perfringens]|uniref:restriction endonuclease subunit S n=1 Tax=Clostridium perfringens TaxID=1502 RepID=UPI000B38CD02|nr:restriction endonuclease subunit S [Clostridium perfringens]OUN54477.1 hypothetical protein B5G18_05780 [Clostridium perfringens]